MISSDNMVNIQGMHTTASTCLPCNRSIRIWGLCAAVEARSSSGPRPLWNLPYRSFGATHANVWRLSYACSSLMSTLSSVVGTQCLPPTVDNSEGRQNAPTQKWIMISVVYV